ncbi:soluble epoxide hydrolase [Aureobasidium pullulans]|uniref:Soluble epoxide hydrolase n=1 Tax=Aureobasidium pullulans TaxID=5580 RepID=A0A4S9C0Y9_AURPU|nr:soluble epoxide hydrolase [Aureobasidium pullulans]
MEIYDYTGQPVIHGRARVNGIRMHYVHAGQGPESLLLLHGTPKTSYYWYKLVPLLTQHFHVIAPDLRGYGDTDKPPITDGYDSATNTQDVSELMTLLNIDKFHVHGEDRGADFAYALAATFRDRVKSLSFCEMAVSGFGLEKMSPPNSVIWCWHLGFFSIPHIPEMLNQGHEREFWEMYMKQECYNPNAIEHAALDHWVACSMQPGGLRGILETHRAGFKNAANHRALLEAGGKLTVRTMIIGAPEFFGPIAEQSVLRVVERVERSEIFEECGHSLALEKAERLAKCLREFMLGVD